LNTPPNSGNHANRRVNHHEKIIHLHVDDSRNNAKYKKTHPNTVFDLPARGRARSHAGNKNPVHRHNPVHHQTTTPIPPTHLESPHAPSSSAPSIPDSEQDKDTQYGENVGDFGQSESDDPQQDFIFYEMMNENFDLFADDSQYNGTNSAPGGPTNGVLVGQATSPLIPPAGIQVLSITKEAQISTGDGIATYAVAISFDSQSADTDYEVRFIKQ